MIASVSFQIPWSDEKPCLHGICRLIAEFYGEVPGESLEDSNVISGLNNRDCSPLMRELFEFVFHPSIAFNSQFMAPLRYGATGGGFGRLCNVHLPCIFWRFCDSNHFVLVSAVQILDTTLYLVQLISRSITFCVSVT